MANIEIRIQNKLCQIGNGSDGFQLLDSSNKAHLTFSLYVFLKQKYRWKTSLNGIYDSLPVPFESNRNRGISILKALLLSMSQKGFLTVSVNSLKDNRKSLHLEAFEKVKPTDGIMIINPRNRSKFFAVDSSVFDIAKCCGYKAMALWLILKKNEYTETDLGLVAKYKVGNLVKVSKLSKPTVIKYLRKLEENYYIIGIKGNNPTISKEYLLLNGDKKID